MQVEPYLIFDGRCEEALEFYKRALGAEVTSLMRYKESPEPDKFDPSLGEKIMHAGFRIGETTVMASDDFQSGRAEFKGIWLTLTVPDVAASERVFAALAEGGSVQMPLAETFYSPSFGMVTDRFGVPWMVIVSTE